jgi:hypothetical protein
VRQLLLLIFLSLSLNSFAAIKLEMSFPSSVVQQGELTQVNLRVSASEGETLDLNSLKGLTFADTLYFYDVTNESAQVLFIKVPQSDSLSASFAERPAVIEWNTIEVRPTEASKKLIFGTFEVPKRVEWMAWALIALLATLVLGIIGWIVGSKVKNKKAQKAIVLAAKNQLLGAKSYEEIVLLWQNKRELIARFPHIEGPFSKFETVLNKYQFKSRQSEAEKIEITESYRSFVRSIEGGFHGV